MSDNAPEKRDIYKLIEVMGIGVIQEAKIGERNLKTIGEWSIIYEIWLIIINNQYIYNEGIMGLRKTI